MSAEHQITPEAYHPDDELRELLADELAEATVEYDDERELDAVDGMQQSLTITLGDEQLTGTETTAAIGFLASYQGMLGFAAAVVLMHAQRLGVPTQIYTDEATMRPGRYHDLTAEWYAEPAVAAGLPESRLERRVVDFEAAGIEIETLERYARYWLSIDD